MDKVKSAREHLEAALDALIVERAELTSAVDALSAQIREVSRFLGIGPAVDVGSMHATVRSEESTDGLQAVPPVLHVPPVRKVVEDVASSGEVFSFDDVMNRLLEVGNYAQTASVSSIISRHPMIRRGPKRGTYQLRLSDPLTEQPTLDTDNGLRQNTSSVTGKVDDIGSESFSSTAGAAAASPDVDSADRRPVD
jgi:hypothetical protein